MNAPFDDEMPDHLWDPRAPAPPAVQRLEELLVHLRFDPSRAPLRLARRSARRAWPKRAWRVALGTAAVFCIVVTLAALRWSWPQGRGWPMTVDVNGFEREGRLEVGRELRLDSSEAARLQVARIGAMDLGPGSVLALRTTSSNRHRLVLTRGTLRTRVWAPPGSVVIKTPAGDVIDLGCVFRLDVSGEGVTRLRVESGWVQLENVAGEVLVPAGASSAMVPGFAPRVPLFDDAAEAFRRGVRALEDGLASGSGPKGPLGFLAHSRPRDVISLLMLAARSPAVIGRPLLERAAALVPPPAGVSVEAILRGERDGLWRWHDALDLPPPKSWWLHWRDAFSRPSEPGPGS
jgi:ferric-dicitrate binding protein FerR (iron transport regulator)